MEWTQEELERLLIGRTLREHPGEDYTIMRVSYLPNAGIVYLDCEDRALTFRVDETEMLLAGQRLTYKASWWELLQEEKEEPENK